MKVVRRAEEPRAIPRLLPCASGKVVVPSTKRIKEQERGY